MESGNARIRSSFWLALGISLLLHAAILGFSASDPPSGSAAGVTGAPHPRLLATLASPPNPTSAQPTPRRAAAPASVASKPMAAARRPAAQRRLVTQGEPGLKRSWSAAERADMDKFLNELAAEARPPGGRELSERALAMARATPALTHDAGEDPATLAATKGQEIEPYSLAMYFDAFVRKMNRSAAFVSNDRSRRRGSRKALVEITLSADGSLKSYRVLRSGDQAAEIAYIKSVIDRASPFSAFPRDIRRASDSLSILMCILPTHAGEGGGFSRSFGAQDCSD